MKCKKCGADLKLSDEVCPYCGAVNYAAKRHIRDRKFYAQDYQSTHKQVSDTDRKSSSYMVRGITCGVLAVLVVVLLFVGFHAESRAYLRKQEWAVDHYDEVKAQMENYLEAGKYYEFYAYCDSYHLTGWTAGPFLEYYPVMEGAQIYYFLNSHINQYLAADNVYDRNEQLEDICGLLPEFYDVYSLHYKARDVVSEEETARRLQPIYDAMSANLQTYLGLTKEEAANLSNMKKDDMLLLFGEKANEK